MVVTVVTSASVGARPTSRFFTLRTAVRASAASNGSGGGGIEPPRPPRTDPPPWPPKVPPLPPAPFGPTCPPPPFVPPSPRVPVQAAPPATRADRPTQHQARSPPRRPGVKFFMFTPRRWIGQRHL